MASLSSAGIGSGLDVNGIVTKLMSIESQPLVLLQQKEASYQAKLSAYGNLKSAVSTLQSAVTSLKTTSLYTAMSATVSDSSVASASAVATAVAGSYQVNVTSLAKAQNLATKANFSSHTSDIASANGKIKIELGTYSGGVFTADSAKTPTTLEIDAGSSSLDDIRDQINASSAGVRASVVYVGKDGTGTDIYKLSLTAKESGAANSMRITVMDSSDTVLTDNTGLAQLSYDPTKAAGTGNEFDVATPAQDAQLTIDGIAVTRSSNTITDAINGVTLTLAKEDSFSVKIAKDTAGVKTTINSFVTAYNELNTLIHELSAYDADTKTAAVLTGDSGIRSLQSALRQMIFYSPNIAGSSVNTLSSIGVTLQKDGSLEFDATKYDEADSADVAALFSTNTSSTQGLAVKMSNVVNSMLADNGLLASRTDGITRTIDSITDQQEAMQRRLAQVEKRYLAQYSALDTLLANMQSTSSYLTQQLAKLPSASS